jgi:hypothetical protein
MGVASGSCFIWNNQNDNSFWEGKDISNFPLSARAWCGGAGDKPTVQFYKGGNCAEDTEFGGENNKDDKGLLFNTADTCGTYDAAADKDGPFAALGAFSCVQVVDSMNEFNTCASISATDEDVKGITGFPQADNNAVYTLAAGVCAREPRAIDVSVWKQGMIGTATAVTQQDGTSMMSNSPCYDVCATMMTPVTANKDTKYSAKGSEGAKCTMYGASKTPELCTDNTVTPPQRFMSYGGSNTRSFLKEKDGSYNPDPKTFTETPLPGSMVMSQMNGAAPDFPTTEFSKTAPEWQKWKMPFAQTSFGQCMTVSMARKCSDIPLSQTAVGQKAMADLEYPSRPVNVMMVGIIVGAVVVAAVVVVAVVVVAGAAGGGGAGAGGAGATAAVQPAPVAP